MMNKDVYKNVLSSIANTGTEIVMEKCTSHALKMFHVEVSFMDSLRDICFTYRPMSCGLC